VLIGQNLSPLPPAITTPYKSVFIKLNLPFLSFYMLFI
jgi:hypothetical protein